MDQPSTPPPGTLTATVPTKARHDGWTPARQHAFITALAESGCVTEACAAVGIAPTSAYRLRARLDASIFRQAWDVALDYAIRRLGDAALSRALHGVARPIFYQGEQIGERRHFDERLTMFLLRYRDPVRYGAWLDAMEARRHLDGTGITLAHALNSVFDAAHDAVPFDDDDDPDRPLAEGPPPSGRSPVPDYAGPEEHRDLAEAVRALGNARRHAAEDADPSKADWRSPSEVRRPRRQSGRTVP